MTDEHDQFRADWRQVCLLRLAAQRLRLKAAVARMPVDRLTSTDEQFAPIQPQLAKASKACEELVEMLDALRMPPEFVEEIKP
jgi:hypothetical protein